MELAYNAALVPVVMGLVQVVKMVGLPGRYAPLLSVILGVGLNYLVTGGGMLEMSLGGVVVGLASSGLYSGVEAMK